MTGANQANQANQEWLHNCATQQQLDRFNNDGYLVVEDALSPEMVQRLTQAVDRIGDEERERKDLDPHQLLDKFRVVIEDDIFLEFIFGSNSYCMAFYICMGTHTRKCPEGQLPGGDDS